MTRTGLRIAAVARVLPQHGIGGMQAVTWDLVSGLAREGHSVELFTTDHPDHLEQNVVEEDGGLRVSYLGVGSPGRYSRRWFRALPGELHRAQAATPYDVLLSFSAAARGLLQHGGARRLGCPSVVATFGTHLDEFRAALWSTLGDRSLRNVLMSGLRAGDVVYRAARDASFMRSPDLLVVPCPGDAVKICRTFLIDPSRTRVIPYGVAESVRGHLRGTVDRDSNLVVLVARLEPDKGVEVALRAIAEVRQAVPEVRMRVVGEGSSRRGLEMLAVKLGLAGVVQFVGAVPYDRIWTAYTGACLVVNPRLRPTAYDHALVVGMASGVPVVTTDFGDIRFVVVPGKNAVTVPPARPGALADALRACLTNRIWAAEIGADGARTIERRFSLEGTVRDYARTLEEMARTPRGR